MSWKSLIDKALGADFDKPQYDPAVGQKKLVRQIDLAAKQFEAGTTRAPNKAWKAGGTKENPSIRFAAKIDGRPVLLDGDEEVFIPTSRFKDFLKHLKKSVEAGELDTEIRTALESDSPASAPQSVSTRTSRRTGTQSAGTRNPLSNLRSSVGQSMNRGHDLDAIAAKLKAEGKYSDEDINAVIAEKRAATA